MTIPRKNPPPRVKVLDAYHGIFIRREDKPRFDHIRAGKPAVQFMAELIAEKTCEHPQEQRVAHVAMYREDGEAINMNDPFANVTVRGYYCKDCGKFVFPEPIA